MGTKRINLAYIWSGTRIESNYIVEIIADAVERVIYDSVINSRAMAGINATVM